MRSPGVRSESRVPDEKSLLDPAEQSEPYECGQIDVPRR